MAILPEGLYRGTIKKHGFGKSSQKETPYVSLEVRLTHGEDDQGLDRELDKPVTRELALWLSEKAAPITAANLRSLGFTGEFSELSTFPFAGQAVTVNVYHEPATTKQGKAFTREKVELIRKSRLLDGDEINGLGNVAAYFNLAQKEAIQGRDPKEQADLNALFGGPPAVRPDPNVPLPVEEYQDVAEPTAEEYQHMVEPARRGRRKKAA